MKKELNEISWKVDEPTYRKNKSLSYSTIAKFHREGFEKLDKLFDKVESPSLLLGSLVDCITTDGNEEYDNRYFVVDMPEINDKIIDIIKTLFNNFKDIYDNLLNIPDKLIIFLTEQFSYQLNWKDTTRAKVIKEKGADYYNYLYLAGDKVIISSELNNLAHEMANLLIESEQTKSFFTTNTPFSNIRNYYQLKFKSTIDDVPYRCMFDIIQVDYEKKTIQPVDVKTSYKPTYNFYKSFLEWCYWMQCELYARILKENIKKDEYFKDFTILPYKDIVISKSNMIPLVWDWEYTFTDKTIYLGKNNQIELKHPLIVGKELYDYLNNKNKVPNEINIETSNSLSKWINKL